MTSFLNRITNETRAVLVQSAADPEYRINTNDPFIILIV